MNVIDPCLNVRFGWSIQLVAAAQSSDSPLAILPSQPPQGIAIGTLICVALHQPANRIKHCVRLVRIISAWTARKPCCYPTYWRLTCAEGAKQRGNAMDTKATLSRRGFLRNTGLAGAAALTGLPTPTVRADSEAAKVRRPVGEP
ncbi:MAG: twin-arginine translocation signal domain-containing protein, partial [Gammaproteobacteria bacterium]